MDMLPREFSNEEIKKRRVLGNSKWTLAVLYIIYFLTLQWVYQEWVVSVYGYQGFSDNFSAGNFFVSSVILAVFLPAMKNNESPSSIFIHLIFGLILVPSLVLYSGQSLDDDFMVVTCVAFAFIWGTVSLLRLKRISFPKVKSSTLLVLSFVFSLCTILGIFAFGGARFVNFDFSEVYEIRREAANAIPGIFGYLNSIVTKIVIPFGMILCLFARRWMLMILLFSTSIAFFALTAHKSPLFYPLLVLFFFFATGSKNLKVYFVLALLAGVLLSGLDLWSFEHEITGWDSWFSGLFVNRALLVPSYLNSLYVDHFSNLEKYYWASSKLSLGLVDSTYELSAPNLIGQQYFGNEDMSANTGWIGSGFANAGYVGVIVYSVLIGMLLSFLDAYARKLGARVVISLFIIPVITMVTSADMTDMILTHGLVVAILILLVWREKSVG
ncbi:oligosaccharide repeat unit polymerase [Variovorax sp. LT1R20]|uniref:oligosaccharide repeat unit polymerase n=1 Tax=Variovorax sp. LT1R20 TaxID=3443729 RepID=UPI003F473185